MKLFHLELLILFDSSKRLVPSISKDLHILVNFKPNRNKSILFFELKEERVLIFQVISLYLLATCI